MTDERYDTTTRRHLLKLSAGGLAALAGCSGTTLDDDPNPYDYTFVKGKELAANLPQYEDEDVKTRTYVAFEDTVEANNLDAVRLYTASPPDTMHDFRMGENIDGNAANVVKDALGEEFHDPDHTDVLLDVYGTVKNLEDKGADVYDAFTFMAEDARRADESTTGNTTTAGDQ